MPHSEYEYGKSLNKLHISLGDSSYPPELQKYLGNRTPKRLTAIGDLDLLSEKALALFCSIKCPGSLILQTYDLAQSLKRTGVTVIGGFHSPMERECLTILLRSNPIIICPARSIENMRLASEYKKPIAEGRLLLLSPFTEKQRRSTIQIAQYRNQVVAALAEQVFVAYAEQHGKTEQFCHTILTWGKRLYTLESDANINLMAMGATLVTPDSVQERI